MAKKKRQKKIKSSSKVLTYTAWVLTVIALTLSTVLAGYYIGYNSAKEELSQQIKIKKSKEIKEPEKKKENVKRQLKKILKKELHNQAPKVYISAAHELDEGVLAPLPKIQKHKRKLTTSKPKLAIIIDDVGTRSQVDAIKSLHLTLTMSFLPPSAGRPNTPKLAAKEPFYMVHLPMEAMHWSAEEPNTLHIHDSQKIISKRIDTIKKLFPKVHYINNHTGSKFTADERAMNRLIFALKKNNINFIDSRTTAKTKVPNALKKFGLQYLSRDIFLDHHMDKAYVLKQIKHAIKIAKSHGNAIAIGHPHKNTLQALYESKELLKEVNLVLINKIR